MADDDDRPREDFRDVAGMGEDTDAADDDAAAMDMPDQPDGGVSGTLRAIRKRLAERRVRKQAGQLQKQKRKRERRERLAERTAPAREEAQAARNEAALLASELGISTDDASRLATQARQRLAAAQAAGGGALAQLDTDGDGDTDLLEGFEATLDQQRATRRDAFEPPVGEVEDDLGTMNSIEDQLGMEGPIEDDIYDDGFL